MNEPYFLAVCKDRPEDPSGFIYTVYFVNNTGLEIENLAYETGGYATFADELVQTSTHSKNLGNVPPYSAIEIETDDEGSFDFVIYFNFQLKMEDTTQNKHFTIGKYLSGGKRPFKPLPVLNKNGHAFTK